MKEKFVLNMQLFASVESAIKELTDPEMLNYARTVELGEFLGDELFPDRKTQSLKAQFVANQNLLPKSAYVHAFDTKTHIQSRDGFESFEFEKILIKEQIPIKEELMMILNQPRNPVEYDETLQQIFDDAKNVMTAVKVRAEAMKMDVLANGQITVDENGVQYVLDYGVPAEHKETISTETEKWSDTKNSKPIEDIQAWVDKIEEDTGITPTRALTSRKVLRLLQANESVQLAINGENYKSRTITQEDLNNFFDRMGLPELVVYEKKYRVETVDGVSQRRFFPEDKFVIFPEDNLGEGLYGATPTEIRRVKKNADDIPFGNIYVTVREELDPVMTVTKAEGLFVPSFPAYNEVFQAKVI